MTMPPASSWRISTLKKIALILAIVLLGVEAIVVAYYWDFGLPRLKFELTMSAFIVCAVGLPVIVFVVLQNERLRVLSERLAHLSATDQMTGLLNRETFLDRLGLQLFAAKDKSGGVFAYVDADHFKRLNDRFGHMLGDKVIQLLARHIRASTRQGDLCARLGGEEFGIFLTGATLDEAGAIAERLRRDVNASERELNIPGVAISVSIGIAAHRPGEGALETMQAADRSLYAAKHDGRNAVVVELRRYRAA
jgi:diguanylate cyclase (GGDEF)-like protein